MRDKLKTAEGFQSSPINKLKSYNVYLAAILFPPVSVFYPPVKILKIV